MVEFQKAKSAVLISLNPKNFLIYECSFDRSHLTEPPNFSNRSHRSVSDVLFI